MKEEKTSSKKAKRLVLIDANAIIHRAFHALPTLSSPRGEPTNAVYGFTTILLRILRELKPDSIVGAFDTPQPTFRHAAYEQYKATRVKAPDELYLQIPRIKEVLDTFGINRLEKEGFEADDVIGTIVQKVRRADPKAEIVIVTGDMDTLQLVDARTRVWTMKKGVSESVLYGEDAVKNRFGITPDSLPDYKGLRGDPSDNIPGVKGIGEKTASLLLQKYGTLEKLYAALDKGALDVSEAIQSKLKAGKEDAFFSRTLGTIRRDVPLDFDPRVFAHGGTPQNHAVEKLFRELGFFSLLKRLSEETSSQKLPGKGAKGEKREEAPLPFAAAARSFPGVSEFGKAFTGKAFGKTALLFDKESEKLIVAVPSGEIFRLHKADFSHRAVGQFFENNAAKFIFDAKPLYKALLATGIRAGGIFDFLLASYLLNPGQGEYTIDELIVRELAPKEPPAAVEERLRVFFELGKRLRVRLETEELIRVFETIEQPLTPILAEMEEVGVLLDTAWLATLSKKLKRELSAVTEAIYQDAGTSFNIASPPQVADVLFRRLAIGIKGIRRTGGGKISTRFSELTKLIGRHPIVEKILRHRELSKLKTTYVDTLPGFLGPDGRLHTTFNQAGTETGRLASADPNLQNIPVKTEFGREVRRAFVADKGWTFVSFDYSQIELRIAADLANDEKMIEAFEKGLDIHALTAAEVNNIPLERVTPELRRKAKALNFGVLYGMGARGFAESAGVSIDEAEAFIHEYFHDFQGIARFIEETKEFARSHGFVKTAFGRKRYLPGITSSHPMIRNEAERMAVNMPIQGTATGDIMKKAMIGVRRLLKEKFSGEVRLLLQIHDELLCEMRDGAVTKIIPPVSLAMENVWQGRVRLKVDVKRGKNWAELE